MKQIILNGIHLDELIEKISTAVQAKIDKIQLPPNKADPAIKYLSRAEVAKLLKISLPTLHDWTKLKLLQSYKIGSRVLYNQEEVEKAILQSTNLKYKKTKS